jgi:hypothetical protein
MAGGRQSGGLVVVVEEEEEEEERARRWHSDGGGPGYMAVAQAEVWGAARATCRHVFPLFRRVTKGCNVLRAMCNIRMMY